mmetsp:Transcript_25270/g.42884  ORF Transcript_25270/g.42884 Transcript_25270/m.42884 type:complete len:85 (-) Transcript_25270:3-257(-)
MAKRDAAWLFDCCASGDVAGDECRLGGGGGNRCCKGERGLDMMLMPKMESQQEVSVSGHALSQYLFTFYHPDVTSLHLSLGVAA